MGADYPYSYGAASAYPYGVAPYGMGYPSVGGHGNTYGNDGDGGYGLGVGEAYSIAGGYPFRGLDMQDFGGRGYFLGYAGLGGGYEDLGGYRMGGGRGAWRRSNRHGPYHAGRRGGFHGMGALGGMRGMRDLHQGVLRPMYDPYDEDSYDDEYEDYEDGDEMYGEYGFGYDSPRAGWGLERRSFGHAPGFGR